MQYLFDEFNGTNSYLFVAASILTLNQILRSTHVEHNLHAMQWANDTEICSDIV